MKIKERLKAKQASRIQIRFYKRFPRHFQLHEQRRFSSNSSTGSTHPPLPSSQPAMAASRKAVEVRIIAERQRSKKWCLSLGEDIFRSSATRNNFPEGSIFSPMLFGSFFDPADEFPLWEFEQESLLSGLPAAAKGKVGWDEGEDWYVLRAQLPVNKLYGVEICLENEKVIEISKQWRESGNSKKDWRTGHWWEYGHVRRLELPDNANGVRAEAYMDGDIFLEIRIPKHKSAANNIPD